MTKTLPSAAPAHAVRVWSDGTSLFYEVPGINGAAPHISKLSPTEGALSRLLRILATRFASAPISDRIGIPAHPLPRELAARAVLRKLGMI